MKVLFISPVMPYPLISGGRIRAYYLLKSLSQKHQITLFTFLRKGEEKYLHQVKKICHKIVFVKRSQRGLSLPNLLLALFTPFPLLVCSYLSLKARSLLKKELKKKYDLISCETFYLLPLLLGLKKPPVVLTEHNIEYLVFKNYIKDFFWLIRPLLLYDVLKLYFWERFFWQKAALVAAVSYDDKVLIERKIKSKVYLIPNGINPNFFNFKTKPRVAKHKTILFVGNFNWLPNKTALKFIINDIWPELKKTNKFLKLLLVGINFPLAIKKALKNSKRIIIKENIADIRKAFAQADLLLAPLKIGRGTRYKILEAMAASCPVVTTLTGIKGIKAKNGYHFILGENKKELIKGVKFLLTNKSKSLKIAKQAQKMVKKLYNWEKIVLQLEKSWVKALSSKN